MDYKPILERLNTIQPMTPEALSDLERLFEPITLDKGDFLIREGERAHHIYILIDGVIRVYYANNGMEYNKTFFTPNSFPTALTALLSDAACELNFQALIPCNLVRFSYREYRKLFEQHRCLESFMLRIMEQIWVKKERHDIRMVTQNATDNYLIFREEHPGLEQQIPQYHIASYLGITPI